MPELPDILAYQHALRNRLLNQPLQRILIRSPSILRTFDPPIESAHNTTVTHITRIGKRIVISLNTPPAHPDSPPTLHLIFHLMIAGRFHWRKPELKPRSRNDLAALHFPTGSLLLTEASLNKRATLHLVPASPAQPDTSLAPFNRGGIDPLTASLAEFTQTLQSENHTLKRSLTDPRLFDGIGNAYSDEILHAAQLSPLQWTSRLTDQQIAKLHQSTRQTLTHWIDLLAKKYADRFPEKVTAFHTEMAVHGKHNQPCPVCQTPVQRIVYAANETNYCPRCQTHGKILADRALSRLLKNDWPKTIEQLEELHNPTPDPPQHTA